MISQSLLFARAFEHQAEAAIPASARPVFHFTPRTGWMNDPNGFSYYKGQYHLFYQYYPYRTEWNSMHWGHAVSDDLLHWTYLPAALAPDEPYDSFGCFSGSAVTMDDGRQLLMYTGVRKTGGDEDRDHQTQCLAIGDGVNYVKYAGNPVLDEKDLPEGLSCHDFRDPHIWRDEDGRYNCIAGSCGKDRYGVMLLFRSEDGFSWKRVGTLIRDNGRFGRMWECPDFFMMDGKAVLIVSPQDMLPEGFEYQNGNGTLAQTGTFDEETGTFTPETQQALDYGIDFYAPQTLLAPDGRRIMIAWMQNWDTCRPPSYDERKWFGQMTIPRELFLRDGKFCQRPVRELESLRSGRVEYRDVTVSSRRVLPGVEGRPVELNLHIRPADGRTYHKFSLHIAEDEQAYTVVSYRPHESVLKLDRTFSGSRRAFIHQRRCLVKDRQGELDLRIIVDRFSVEVFVNDGEQTMTATIFTDPGAAGISFEADGEVRMDVIRYALDGGK